MAKLGTETEAIELKHCIPGVNQDIDNIAISILQYRGLWKHFAVANWFRHAGLKRFHAVS